MNFFEEASKINQSISDIDKKIYILNIERNNTESEWPTYHLYITLSKRAQEKKSLEEWNKHMLSLFDRRIDNLSLQEQELVIKECMSRHHAIISRHFVKFNIQYTWDFFRESNFAEEIEKEGMDIFQKLMLLDAKLAELREQRIPLAASWWELPMYCRLPFLVNKYVLLVNLFFQIIFYYSEIILRLFTRGFNYQRYIRSIVTRKK